MKNPLCSLGIDLHRANPDRCGRLATHQAMIGDQISYSCPEHNDGLYTQYPWREITIEENNFPKDAHGDWDWRQDRQRNPRLIKKDLAARDAAFILLRLALKNNEVTDFQYQCAEDAFTAGNYVVMNEALTAQGISKHPHVVLIGEILVVVGKSFLQKNYRLRIVSIQQVSGVGVRVTVHHNGLVSAFLTTEHYISKLVTGGVKNVAVMTGWNNGEKIRVYRDGQIA